MTCAQARSVPGWSLAGVQHAKKSYASAPFWRAFELGRDLSAGPLLCRALGAGNHAGRSDSIPRLGHPPSHDVCSWPRSTQRCLQSLILHRAPIGLAGVPRTDQLFLVSAALADHLVRQDPNVGGLILNSIEAADCNGLSRCGLAELSLH